MESGSADALAEKYGAGCQSSVDDELAKMKAEMGLTGTETVES